MNNKYTNLVWIDTEGIQGLDIRRGKIIQIAMIITNQELEVLDEGIEMFIHHPDKVFLELNDWEKENYPKNGFIENSRNSQITTEDAEKILLEKVKEFVNPKVAPLCGNSVYMDRGQLMRNMPKLNEYLHYRNIDISTMKELYKRWYPEKPLFQKKETHTALSDILESIDELKFYRKNIFV
jgi:oligoribonuclease